MKFNLYRSVVFSGMSLLCTSGTLCAQEQMTLVTTVAGAEKIEAKTDKSSEGWANAAKLWKPDMMAFGKDGALYILEDDDRDILRYKDGRITTFIKDADSDLMCRYSGIAFSIDKTIMYIANDMNGKGSAHIVAIPWKDDHYDTTDLQVVWDKVTGPEMDAGITNVAVHPVTGDVLSVAHGSAEIYKLNKKTNLMEATGVKLPNATGGNAEKVKVRSWAFSADGKTVYICSQNCHVIYRGTYDLSSGIISGLQIWAGTYGTKGYALGDVTETLFEEPIQIAMGPDNCLYVPVRKKHNIIRITEDGVSELVTGTGKSGITEGPLSEAQFNHPGGMVFDEDGILYEADYWNHMIRRIGATWVADVASKDVIDLSKGYLCRKSTLVGEGSSACITGMADGEYAVFYIKNNDVQNVTVSFSAAASADNAAIGVSLENLKSRENVFTTTVAVRNEGAAKYNSYNVDAGNLEAGLYRMTLTFNGASAQSARSADEFSTATLKDLAINKDYSTGIENVNDDYARQQATGIYTLDGRRLSTDDPSQLPAGFYIVNGKKTVIR